MSMNGIVRYKNGTKDKYIINNMSTYKQALDELNTVPNVRVALVVIEGGHGKTVVDADFEPQTA